MKRFMLASATIAALATPALADEVGAHVGPIGVGVTTGHGPDYDRDRTTIVKEHEPRDRTTVIKEREPSERTT